MESPGKQTALGRNSDVFQRKIVFAGALLGPRWGCLRLSPESLLGWGGEGINPLPIPHPIYFTVAVLMLCFFLIFGFGDI